MLDNKPTRRAQWSAAASLVLAVATLPLAAKAEVVSDWNATTQTVLAATGGSPGIYYAMVHVAIYDAVNAIDASHQVFAVRPRTRTAGASREAAAAAVAYHVLLALYPGQQPLDPALPTSLASAHDRDPKTRGIAIDTEVAPARRDVVAP